MKIGILTFHNSENYGASLQCFALQKILRDLVEDCNVINFKKEKVFVKENRGLFKYISLPKMARVCYGIFYQKELKIKQKRFKDFTSQYLTLSSEEYVREENISDAVHEYDGIVFGSDQIWNLDPRVYDRSHIYFGDFNYVGKKIAYGASFGDNIEIVNLNREYVLNQVGTFDAVSVRETNAQIFLQNNGIKSELVLDPTLLLKKNDWDIISGDAPVIEGDYILYYSVNCRPYSWKVAKKLSELTGLKVINLVEHPKIVPAGFDSFYKGGPIEFLNIIKNARYVVTNSFHGTVFSIIFEKTFIPVFAVEENKIVVEERKYTLLKGVGLEWMMHTEEMELDLERISNIDYNAVKKKLDEMIKNSKAYLKENLENSIYDTVRL